jgi:hypothetical protein
VPGYAVVPERMGGPPLNWNGESYTDVNGRRQGWGVTFHMQANQSDWFHAPIPTPTIVEDRRATLSRVMVLFECPEGSALNEVHVWDGPNLIWHRAGLTSPGNPRGLDINNTFDVNHDGITWGVGVSLHISAVRDTDILFTGAGADFRHDI